MQEPLVDNVLFIYSSCYRMYMYLCSLYAFRKG